MPSDAAPAAGEVAACLSLLLRQPWVQTPWTPAPTRACCQTRATTARWRGAAPPSAPSFFLAPGLGAGQEEGWLRMRQAHVYLGTRHPAPQPFTPTPKPSHTPPFRYLWTREQLTEPAAKVAGGVRVDVPPVGAAVASFHRRGKCRAPCRAATTPQAPAVLLLCAAAPLAGVRPQQSAVRSPPKKYH